MSYIILYNDETINIIYYVHIMFSKLTIRKNVYDWETSGSVQDKARNIFY